MTCSAWAGLRRTVARLLLATFLLPAGPVLGMGVVVPSDLGLRISEPAPGFGAHVSVTHRTTTLALARQAARGAWLGIAAQLGGIELSSSTSELFSAGETLSFAATSRTDALPRAARENSEGQLPLADVLPQEIPPPPTPPDARPSPVRRGASTPRAETAPASAGSVRPLVAVPVVPAFNLLSISWQPNDPAPGAVFLPIQSAVRRVFAFDACDTADPWKLWDPANPGASDLTSITPAKGFWLEGTGAATLPEGGPEPVTTSIPLCLGWNLIGFPLSSPRPVGAALAAIAGQYLRVFGFDPTDADDPWEVFDVAVPAWANDLAELRPGRGYWIYVTQATTLTVSNEADLPTVSIQSPADLAEVTGPVPIVGTVRSPSLASWSLSFRAVGDPDWIDLGAGTMTAEAQPLAIFDPTLLENGLYEVRLRAVDSASNFAETTIALAVEGQRKIGHFSLAFVDLEVPLSGIPIQVIRSYDSRRRHRSGDFGFGWELELKSGSYRTNRGSGDGWNIAQGFLPCDTAQELRSHLSTVKLSDREIYRFRPVLTQLAPGVGGCYGVAGFAFVDGPVPGATLAVLGNSNIFWATGSSQLLDTDGDPFNPSRVRLTTRDGRAFELDRGFGVTKVTDSNGNSAAFNATGISHSSGSSITIERDGSNRITRLVDPQGADLLYTYAAAGDLATFTDRGDAVSTYSYAPDHYLEEIEDPRGVTPIRNEYGPDGRLLRHIDAFGNEIEYDHQLAANREIVTNRLGASRLLEYDARGNVTREVDESGVETTRIFDADDQLLSESDELGNVSSYVYDANRNLTATTDPLGNVTSFAYDAKGNVLTSTDPRGGVAVNVYDARSNLTRTTDALGAATTYAYNARGELLTEIDTLGGTTGYQYDARGRVTHETDALGHVATFTYNSNGERLTETRTRTLADGTTATEITRFAYDVQGRLLSTTAVDGTITRAEYDVLGNVTASIDALGRRTELTYDELGRQTRGDYPDGTFEETVYDAENRRASFTDRSGSLNSYEYDPAGRLRRTILADGATPAIIEQVYDTSGRLSQTIDPRGHATTFAYDAAGRRASITDALGQVTSFAYDAAGNQVAMVDPRGFTTAFVYDAGNRLIRTIAPDATFRGTGYDALGRRIAETDESGLVTQFGYDALGRLAGVTDALNQVTTYAYDEAGNRISQTDANGHITRFEFDSVGRQTKRILPDGALERFTYDAVGNRASRTDFMGRTTLYDYDVASRLLTRTHPGGVEVSFTYSPTGRRLTATDQRGTTSYGYDDRDRVTSLIDPAGRELLFAFDAAGNRTALTANAAGRTLTTSYTYDDLNRLDTVTDPEGGVYDHNYDPNGNRESLLFPNGVATTYAYNAKNQLLNISTINNAGTTLVSFAYTLAPTGNRTKITEHDGVTRNYVYDNLYRLTDEHVRNGVAPDAPTAWRNGFIYDPVGNRTQQNRQIESGTPQPVVYDYDTRDRLLTENGPSPVDYGWDQNGNQISKSGTDGATYAWDFENRLTRVVLANGTTIDHVYDVDGVRVRTTTTPSSGPPQVVDYLVDPWHQTSVAGRGLVLSQVVAETDATDTLTAYHVRGDDLLATLRPDLGNPTTFVAKYFHAEGIGTIRALTDEQGNVTDRYTLEAFGTLLSHEGDDPNAYLFAGEPLDPNSGFYYNRARWLDPNAGRFASVDPFGGSVSEPTSLHRYLYVGGHPEDGTDPTGLYEGLTGLAISFAVNGIVNAALGIALGNNAPSGPEFWSNFWSDFFWGGVLAPVGGVFSKLGLRLLQVSRIGPTILAAVGRMEGLLIKPGTAAVDRVLIKFSRLFLRGTRNPPSIGTTLLGRALKRFLPSFSWELHHTLILQSLTKGAGRHFQDFFENEGLRRIANGFWNLAPIPRLANNWISNNTRRASFFAMIWYSSVFFGTAQTVEALSDED